MLNYIDAVRAANAVTLFCWNVLDGLNAAELAREIHGTDIWTYKYREVINHYLSRAWPAALLHELPEEQAAELMEYCVNYYENN